MAANYRGQSTPPNQTWPHADVFAYNDAINEAERAPLLHGTDWNACEPWCREYELRPSRSKASRSRESGTVCWPWSASTARIRGRTWSGWRKKSWSCGYSTTRKG